MTYMQQQSNSRLQSGAGGQLDRLPFLSFGTPTTVSVDFVDLSGVSLYLVQD